MPMVKCVDQVLKSSDENEGCESENSDGLHESRWSSNGSEKLNSSTGNSSADNLMVTKEDGADSQGGKMRDTVGAEGGVNTNINPNAVSGPRSITDEFFRRETDLNDKIDSDKKPVYIQSADPIIDNIVINYKQLAKLHEWYYNQEKDSGVEVRIAISILVNSQNDTKNSVSKTNQLLIISAKSLR